MGQKFRNLIGRIVADDNMRAAYSQTARNKRRSIGYLQFKEYAEANLAVLAAEIADGTYRPGPAHEFWVREPKSRLISALPFRDRVAQHALVNVIGPIFEAGLLPRTYACRNGMGTHVAVVDLQAEMRRMGNPLYALKTDFSRYFHSINRGVLHQLISRKISCAATLRLIEAMTPPTGVGLPIGCLTSQLYANVYAGQVDRLLQCVLKEKHWYRYMDDIVVLGHDQARLHIVKREIERFSASALGLSLSKWSVSSVSRGVSFLGYRIWPTHKLLRRQSVARARQRIRRYRATGDLPALHRFLAAWRGHAQWADAHNLKRRLRLEIRICMRSSTRAQTSTP